MKKAFLIFTAVILTACSTVSGVGQDIKDTAQWTKEKMGGK